MNKQNIPEQLEETNKVLSEILESIKQSSS